MDRVQGVIFDCDGVLFESRKANLAYYNRILSEFRYAPVTPEHKALAHLCHTASSPDVLSRLVKQEDLSPALEFAGQLDYRDFIPFMVPEPSLITMLEEMSLKIPLAVATNRGASILSILEHFRMDHYFSAIVNSRDVPRPKPAPDMLLLAAQKLGVSPEYCLFVGDSELDQMAAERAGVPFVGYGGGIDGDYALENHGQLLEWFSRESGSEYK